MPLRLVRYPCGHTSFGTITDRSEAGAATVRGASGYCIQDIVAAARRAGARFSITAQVTATVSKAITGIPGSAWTAIRYPQAVWDEAEQRLISNVQVAEVPSSRSPAGASRRHLRPADRRRTQT